MAPDLKLFPRLPRRATLTADGRIEELVNVRPHDPHAEEIEQLSQLCAALRDATGAPKLPRATAAVLDVAIHTNDPEAWEAACDDLSTGHFDHLAAATILDEVGAPAWPRASWTRPRRRTPCSSPP